MLPGGQVLPDFFKAVGAARFGVMAGVAAVLTAFFSWFTRRWLLPKLRRRRALGGAVAGIVLMPLAAGYADLGDLSSLGLALMFVGSMTTAALWLRWFRKSLRAPRPARTSRRRVPATAGSCAPRRGTRAATGTRASRARPPASCAALGK